MSELSPDELLARGIRHHQAAQFREAEAVYRQILASNPNHANALHLLGLIVAEAGRPEEGIELIKRAAEVAPAPEFYVNLGNLLGRVGDWKSAANAFRQALNLAPNFTAAGVGLAHALRASGRFDEAIEIYRQAVRMCPADAAIYYGLAFCLLHRRRLDEAIAALAKAAELNPQGVEILNDLGNAHMARGDSTAAESAYRRALVVDPQNLHVHYNLGNALAATDRPEEAEVSYRKAVALQPKWPEALNNLALTLTSMGRLDEALEWHDRVRPNSPGAAYLSSNRLYGLHFNPRFDAKSLHEEHRIWNARYAEPLKSELRPHGNDRSPDRRLKIGYLSPDLREHVVGINLSPLLQNHDADHFEIHCYSAVTSTDAIAAELRQCSHVWRDVSNHSDQATADLIRADRIDILIDLTLHMAGNRLLVFARKPAPVQATYLGYCGTTGLDAIDYRLSDPHLDPPETDLTCYSEQTIRLPTSYWCYRPYDATPDVNDLPAAKNGYVTFGCLNNFAKVSSAAVDAWAQILAAVPGSRMILHYPGVTKPAHVCELFAKHGVSIKRVEFVRKQHWPQYVETLQRTDIALDPFPYAGGITTCDALWMGVPVVTLSGGTAVGRGGRSLLNNVGLPESVAADPDQYVDLASALASDTDRLAQLRAGLRQRMRSSPLMDAKRFARDVEDAYRSIWRRWVESNVQRSLSDNIR